MTSSIRQLVQLGYFVNAAIAARQHTDISKDSVYKMAEGDRLLDFVEQRLNIAGQLVLSAQQRTALNERFASIANCVVPSDFGLDDSTLGLPLVMAMILEEIKIVESERER